MSRSFCFPPQVFGVSELSHRFQLDDLFEYIVKAGLLLVGMQRQVEPFWEKKKKKEKKKKNNVVNNSMNIF